MMVVMRDSLSRGVWDRKVLARGSGLPSFERHGQTRRGEKGLAMPLRLEGDSITIWKPLGVREADPLLQRWPCY